MRKVYVLAANYRHFVAWCNQQGVSPNSSLVEYLQEPRQLMGRHLNPLEDIVYYETWMLHPNASELKARIDIMTAMHQGVIPPLENG